MSMPFNTTGFWNTANGSAALYSNTIGYDNVGIGNSALFSGTTGNYNVGLGANTLNNNVTGNNNTAIGYTAGYSALGSGNVFLGWKAGYNETGSNKLYITNSDVGNPLIYGDFSTGGVGINTTTLPAGAGLVVNGKINATQYCDQNGANCVAGGSLGGGGGGGFGAWEGKTAGTVYQASSDGFVVAMADGPSGSGYIEGYTDSSASPSTKVMWSSDQWSGQKGGVTFPVRKNDYWKVTTSFWATVYWVPAASSGGGASDPKSGYATPCWGDSVTTQTIAHGLGRIPKKISFHFDPQTTTSSGVSGWSTGTWTPTTQSYTAWYDHGTNSWGWSGGTGQVGYVRATNRGASIVASADATNITLTIPPVSPWGICIGTQWDAE
jgi:hypothetical protein